uniref:M56 family metallopeptidase n=1 Tax=Tahibacter caeni TaxID=1453545 RepID=UPI002147BE07
LEAALGASLPRHARIATTLADGPLVIGLLRPCILLPRALTTALAPAVLHDVLRHEIAHIRRGDLWLVAALRVATAVFWWNPFLHGIGARLELAREMACDARAAHGCDSNADYADSLLASVETLLELDEQRDWLAVAMFGRRSHLAQRIDGLVDDDAAGAAPRRTAATALCLILLAACSGAVVAALPRLALPTAAAEPDARVTALLAAARSGDDVTVRRLVRDGADIDARVLDGGTALIQAVRAGDPAMVDTLLELGADPDRASLGQGNPLIAAARLGRQSIVEGLVEAGADVNRVVTYDETPLINAARAGHLATVRYLVAHGADVRFGVEADGWLGRWRTPLNQTRDAAVRAYLLEQGADAARR